MSGTCTCTHTCTLYGMHTCISIHMQLYLSYIINIIMIIMIIRYIHTCTYVIIILLQYKNSLVLNNWENKAKETHVHVHVHVHAHVVHSSCTTRI